MLCPFLPGQEVNVLEVPIQTDSPNDFVQHKATSSIWPEVFTMDPKQKYRKPKPIKSILSLFTEALTPKTTPKANNTIFSAPSSLRRQASKTFQRPLKPALDRRPRSASLTKRSFSGVSRKIRVTKSSGSPAKPASPTAPDVPDFPTRRCLERIVMGNRKPSEIALIPETSLAPQLRCDSKSMHSYGAPSASFLPQDVPHLPWTEKSSVQDSSGPNNASSKSDQIHIGQQRTSSTRSLWEQHQERNTSQRIEMSAHQNLLAVPEINNPHPSSSCQRDGWTLHEPCDGHSHVTYTEPGCGTQRSGLAFSGSLDAVPNRLLKSVSTFNGPNADTPPGLASSSIGADAISPLHLPQPETPSISEFGEDLLDTKIFSDFESPANTPHLEESLKLSLDHRDIVLGGQGTLALSIQNYNLPESDEESLKLRKVRSVPFRPGSGTLSLHDQAGTDLVQPWRNGAEHQSIPLDELVDELAYLGDLII